MDQPKISVIIPVYNAEKYLTDCLNSIKDQSLREIEIICIDDCSTDNSKQIINSLARTDKRIRIYENKINSGAPVSRNIGIKAAKGYYLSFIDADDCLLPEAYKKLYTKAVHSDSDAVKGNMTVQTYLKRKVQHPLNHKKNGDYNGLSNCKEIHHLYQYQTYILRNTIFRKQSIAFDETLKNFQDPVLMAYFLPYCKRISLIMDSVYLKCKRKKSITTSDWDLENYRSLILGAKKACISLINKGYLDIAYKVAKTPSHWHHKFTRIPESISKEECFDVFSYLKDFYNEIKMPLWDNSKTPNKIKLILTLAILGYYDQAYKLLKEKTVNDKLIDIGIYTKEIIIRFVEKYSIPAIKK